MSDGDAVRVGNALVMIAMKMEYVLKTTRNSIVERVSQKVGDFVANNTPLVHFKESGEKGDLVRHA